MAGTVAVPAGAAGGEAPPAGNAFVGNIARLGLMYLAMSWFTSKKSPGDDGSTSVSCNFNRTEHIDVDVFVHPERFSFGQPLWSYTGLALLPKQPLQASLHIGEDLLSPVITANSSMWVTARYSASATQPGSAALDSESGDVATQLARRTWYTQTELIKHRAPKPKRGTKSLLGDASGDDVAEALPPKAATPKKAAKPDPTALPDDTDSAVAALSEELEAARPWKAFWKPNVTVNFIDDFQTFQLEKLPPHLVGKIQLERSTLTYYPIVDMSEFWLLQDYWVELNDTVTEVDLHLEFSAMGNMKFQFQHAIAQSFDMQKSGGMLQGDEQDEMKRVFLEGNPYLLALTTVVSLLHTVFDMLAFKNDIGFWKSNKSMEGLSARSIVINAFCQLVIFFYLLDNETSFIILMSAGVGTAIEFWKVTKAMDVKLAWTASGLPKLSIKDRGSYVDSHTDQYDKEAMKYLSWVMYPAIFCYCCYSLIYQKHKSWYSWVLGSGVGCVYAFGFMLMCPQLYLNYKLKSVAHLPWRQMSYKFLNTIIDDLFAFVIKMPLLHRLSVFRDDLVFLVYIYQRWIYRVDMKRVNEFGFVGEDPNAPEAPALTDGAAPALAAPTGDGESGAAAVDDVAAVGTAGAKAVKGRKNAKKQQVPEADKAVAATSSSKDR